MIFGPCKACVAKDAEIQRLYALVTTLTAKSDPPVPSPVPSPEPLRDALPESVASYLDRRYPSGSRDWRQDAIAARKLLAEGTNEMVVIEALERGQPVEW